MNPEIEFRSPVLAGSILTLWTILLALVTCFLSKLSNLLHSPMHAPIKKFVRTVGGKILLFRANGESSKDIAPKNEEAKKEVLEGSYTSGGVGLMHYWTPCNVQLEEWKRRSRTILNGRCARRQRRWLLQGVFLWAPLHVLKHLGVSLWFADVHP